MRKAVLILLAGLWLTGLGMISRFEWMKARGQVPDFVSHPLADSRTCRECHQAIYDDWKASPHAKALSSTLPRNLDPGDKETNCLPCHAPEPVLVLGLDTPPLERERRREEGVNCAACHQLEAGVAAGRSDSRGACNPVYDSRMATVELCVGCHNAHGTVDQWRASRFPSQGIDCRSCHLPEQQGWRRHRMLGAHDHESLRQAVSLEANRAGDRLSVGVTNGGAGHNLPSGRRSRSMVLVVDFLGARGETLKAERTLYRNPFKGEEGANTQIASGETRTATYPIPAQATRARATLLYQFRPSQPDSAGVLLHKVEIEVR